MTKSNEQLLKDYKKSNKVRRARIIANAGFSTETAYLNYLSGSTTGRTRATTAPAPAKEPEKVVTKVVNIRGKAKLSQILKKFQPKAEVVETVGEDSVDIVIAFDNTGSMSSYINAVKKQVKELIEKWFTNIPNLQIKIVAFGDYCDMTSSKEFGNAYQESKLTNKKEDLIKFVTGAKNTSGGDSDEFYELVIKKIVEETPWRTGKRSILLIADSNPHYVGYSYAPIIANAQIDWKKEARNAKKLGIAIDTLSIHGDRYPWYKELAEMTDGAYLPFSSSNQTGEMISAVAYARGASAEVFFSSAATASTSEMKAVYKTLSKLRDE